LHPGRNGKTWHENIYDKTDVLPITVRQQMLEA
jgi:hypothetical protein